MQHITVLAAEAVSILGIREGDTVVDATFGAGGHALAICERIGPTGTFIGIDADPTAFQGSRAQQISAASSRHHLVTANFADIENVLSSFHSNPPNAILADLGWRQDQFTNGGKGLSFSSNDPLTMTFGDPHEYLFTADDIINHWNEEDIANVLYGYGEERYSRRIAKAIVIERQKQRITTASQLATVISDAVPGLYRRQRIHPATKSFQALRIAVNDELSVLQRFLDTAPTLLAANGTLAIITFHSLEDRMVKVAFREMVNRGTYEAVTKKPIVPSEDELHANPRSRSAKLRAIRRIS